jgi:FtsP/CotA-like multicopper oxidase with cupredoxin domain
VNSLFRVTLKRLILGAAWSVVALATSALSTAGQAARPVLQLPSRVDADSPMLVTATSPRSPQAIDGFEGAVHGLLMYGINEQPPSLRPATWRVEPGKTLEFRLRNDLPCTAMELGKHMRPDQTNMHLHGLLVYSNGKDSQGQYGDNSMLVVDSERAVDSRTGRYRCGNKASNAGRIGHGGSRPWPLGHVREVGVAQFKVSIPADHPYGLSWYHPHVHEVTGYQVGGGMSGLIEIGDVWSYAYAKFSTLDTLQAKLQEVPDDERIGKDRKRLDDEMALRATTKQIPLMLKDFQLLKPQVGAPGESMPNYRYNPSFVADLCGSKPKTIDGVCRSKNGRGAWLFTVNGQVLPRLEVEAGTRQVWRIANVGATVSYQLQLRVTAPAAIAGTVLPLQVLGGDGVAFHQNKASANLQSDFMLLPSARLDLVLDPLQVCRKLMGLAEQAGRPCSMANVEAVLETRGPDLGADQWPAAELMQVSIRSTGEYRQALDPGYFGVSLTRAPHVQATASVPPSAPVCKQGATSIGAQQYRLIGVLNEGAPGAERFAMATQGPYDLNNGRPEQLKIAKSKYLAFNPARLDLCIWADIKNKYFEHWVIKNDSAEVHNFHVHQAKFEVLDHHDGNRSIVASRASGLGIFHDNYPINPGGWILLKIAFDRAEQAGRYMYHCHILEHEDRGMMSMIQVVDVSSPAVKAALRSGEQRLAEYRASVPAWMSDALCRSPR